jgi:prevent-host-death family protein
MDETPLQEARSTLGLLVDKARLAGEPTLITRQGKPAALIVGAEWFDDVLALLEDVAALEAFRARARVLREGRRAVGLKRTDTRVVDHIDGNPWNNDPANLRIVEPKENGR